MHIGCIWLHTKNRLTEVSSMPKRQETYRTVRAGLLIIWSLKRVREADPAKLICEANYSKLFAKQITFGIRKFLRIIRVRKANLAKLFAKQITFLIGSWHPYPSGAPGRYSSAVLRYRARWSGIIRSGIPQD